MINKFTFTRNQRIYVYQLGNWVTFCIASTGKCNFSHVGFAESSGALGVLPKPAGGLCWWEIWLVPGRDHHETGSVRQSCGQQLDAESRAWAAVHLCDAQEDGRRCLECACKGCNHLNKAVSLQINGMFHLPESDRIEKQVGTILAFKWRCSACIY